MFELLAAYLSRAIPSPSTWTFKRGLNQRGEMMPDHVPQYRIQVGPDGKRLGLWKFDGASADRIDIASASTRWDARDGLSVLETIRRYSPAWFEGQGGFYELSLLPGQYYRRMARPDELYPADPSFNPGTQFEASFIAIACSQLSFLTAQLARICQTVHPTDKTLSVYGHEIRNLLILACTEVESHWRGILVANAFDKGKGNWSTKHYVHLQAALRLAEFAVAFPAYPWLQPVRPFLGWGTTGNPTAELAWYAAYNGVKHNREGEFELGTLGRVFEAVSACLVMLCAQFGPSTILRHHSELRDFFYFAELPSWPLLDVYVRPWNVSGWTPVNYPFPKP